MYEYQGDIVIQGQGGTWRTEGEGVSGTTATKARHGDLPLVQSSQQKENVLVFSPQLWASPAASMASQVSRRQWAFLVTVADVPDDGKGWGSQIHYLKANSGILNWIAQSSHHHSPSPAQVETFHSKTQSWNTESKLRNLDNKIFMRLCFGAL